MDDDPLVRNALRRVTSRAGFRVAVAAGAQGAIAIAASERREVIVFGAPMPGARWLEFLGGLRGPGPKRACVVVTGDHDLVRTQLRSDGVVAVVPKPWNLACLLDAIDTAVKQLAEPNQSPEKSCVSRSSSSGECTVSLRSASGSLSLGAVSTTLATP